MRTYLNNIKKNIKILMWVRSFSGFAHGWLLINVLYFASKNLDYTQIGVLLALQTFSILITMFPIGYISDNYNRKYTMEAIPLLTFFSVIVLLLDTNEITLYLWAIFSGISYAASVNSYQILYYENLKLLKQTNQYEHIYNYSYFFFIVTSAISAYFYPIIFGLNSDYPLILSAIFSIFMFLSIIQLKEVKLIKNSHKKAIKNSIKESINELKKELLLWALTFETIWLVHLWLFEELFVQIIIKDNYSFAQFGIIFSISMIVGAFFIKLLGFIFKKINFFTSLTIIVLLSFILLLVFIININTIITVMITISLLTALKVLAIITISNMVNKELKDNMIRGTVLSIMSLISLIGYSGLILISGLMIDKYGAINSLFIENFVFVTIGIFLITWLSIKKKENNENIY